MKFTLKFSCDSEAFNPYFSDLHAKEGLENETSRILQDLAQTVVNGKREGSIRDNNGNRIGTWSLTK